jgi:hypothetical protein
MSRKERIANRCPRFYKGWENSSLVSLLIQSVSGELNRAEEGITDLMRAHWIDSASGEDLDRLSAIVGSKRMPNEDDEKLRMYVKKAVDEYRGGGTISVIQKAFKDLLRSEEFQIIENPIVESFAEFTVIANDSWFLGSNSIEDAQANLFLTVEGEGEVSNPRITNIDTGHSTVFNGKLNNGQQLVIRKDAALLGNKTVTNEVIPHELLQLLRKGSTWKYSEELLERIGVFDEGKFDEHTFALGVPNVKVRFEWERKQPATFMVKVKSEALRMSGFTEAHLKEMASHLKAAGVTAIIKVTE